MSSRQQRRAAEHQARKLAYQAAKSAATTAPVIPNIPEPGASFPALADISPARRAANRANAQFSAGPVTPEGKAISSQNRTTHGLARHTNGAFKLLTSEDPAAFAAFHQSLIDEHQPATPTETLLVNAMVESQWLSERAHRLQSLFLDPGTGVILDQKEFALYLRYQTTHERAFHKALSALLKLRAEKRQAQLGFEAQRIKTEQHEMQKDKHYWEVVKKDGEACAQISRNTFENLKAAEAFPGFEAQYDAELAKRSLAQPAQGGIVHAEAA